MTKFEKDVAEYVEALKIGPNPIMLDNLWRTYDPQKVTDEVMKQIGLTE